MHGKPRPTDDEFELTGNEEELANNPAARWKRNETHKLKNDPRVTSIGKLLLASRLDELPQLWTVSAGEMSLEGPHPIIDSPAYDANCARMHRGIRGCAT